MKKYNLSLVGILGITLVFGMVLLGCDEPEEEDTWSAVTSLNQVDGTWKGSYSQSLSIEEVMVETGATWTQEMQTLFGDMKVTVSVEMTTTVNASDQTYAASMRITQTFSGGNIDIMWPMLKGEFIGQETEGIEMPEGIEVTVDDDNHSITTTVTSPAQPIPDGSIEELLTDLQINQNGTKIKMPAGEASPEEIIMTKQ